MSVETCDAWRSLHTCRANPPVSTVMQVAERGFACLSCWRQFAASDAPVKAAGQSALLRQ